MVFGNNTGKPSTFSLSNALKKMVITYKEKEIRTLGDIEQLKVKYLKDIFLSISEEP